MTNYWKGNLWNLEIPHWPVREDVAVCIGCGEYCAEEWECLCCRVARPEEAS